MAILQKKLALTILKILNFRPFAYEYGVKDEYSGAYFAKQETQDDYGVVTGE